MTMVPFLVFSLSLVCWILPSHAAVYVQTTGNDATGTGTQLSPVRTIARALMFNDNLILLGPGSFDTALYYMKDNLNLNISGSGPKLTTITNPTLYVPYFCLNGTSQSLIISNVLIGPTNNGVGDIRQANILTLSNVEITGATPYQEYGVFNVGPSARLIIDKSYIHDSIPPTTLPMPLIWGDTQSVITLSNSKFYNNALIALTSYSFFVSNCIFLRNTGILSSTGSATISIKTSEFGANYHPLRPVFACGSSASVQFSGNTFCGANGNRWNCDPIFPQPTTNFHDGCGRCGRMTNLDKDCNGVCFGNNQNCRTPRAWYVSTQANSSGDGTTIWKPTTLSTALNLTQYRDTVYLLPGTYPITTSNPLSFSGKAFTIKSYYNDPNTVIFAGTTNNPIITVKSFESSDSVLDGITLSTTGGPCMLVTADSGVTLKNSIVSGGYANYGSGIQVINDGYVVINKSQISQTSGDFAAAIWVTASDIFHSSAVFADQVLFYSNILMNSGTGSVHVGTYSQLTVTNSWFYRNLAQQQGYAADVVIDSSTSWMNITGSSFRETLAPINKTISLYCAANNGLTRITNSLVCPGPTLDMWNLNCNAAVTLVANSTCGGCGSMPGPQDCAGTCFGYATTDTAGTCCNNSAKDCAGICNGPGGYDSQWTCCSNKANIDCLGICNGSARLDCNGVCNGPARSDCSGVCNGTARLDCNGVCNGNATLANGTCQ